MIDAIATKIAVKLKEASPEETASVDMMKFALIGIIHNTLIFITALVVGLCAGQLLETLLAAVSFMILRLVSGGYHFKSPLSCFLFSSFVFIAIPFVPLDNSWFWIINVISLLLVSIFAPSNIKDHIRVSEKFFPVFKFLSILVVAVSILFHNEIVTIAFFAQSLTLITLRKEVREA